MGTVAVLFVPVVLPLSVPLPSDALPAASASPPPVRVVVVEVAPSATRSGAGGQGADGDSVTGNLCSTAASLVRALSGFGIEAHLAPGGGCRGVAEGPARPPRGEGERNPWNLRLALQSTTTSLVPEVGVVTVRLRVVADHDAGRLEATGEGFGASAREAFAAAVTATSRLLAVRVARALPRPLPETGAALPVLGAGVVVRLRQATRVGQVEAVLDALRAQHGVAVALGTHGEVALAVQAPAAPPVAATLRNAAFPGFSLEVSVPPATDAGVMEVIARIVPAPQGRGGDAPPSASEDAPSVPPPR